MAYIDPLREKSNSMSRKPKILVVEDEAAIRDGLVDVFIYHGYDVETAPDGKSGMSLALSGRFDMILLDVMLPEVDGYTICEAIRAEDKSQPIIMLTARSSDQDIIQGLKLGADDYVSKPFSIAELVLRVEAVLRRTPTAAMEQQYLELSDQVRIDLANMEGDCHGESHQFTRREVEVLEYLAASPEAPVSREELLSKVWGYGRHQGIETRTVDIHIAKIRRKIESDPSQPVFLLTVRGAGYRLALPDHSASGG